MADSLQRALSVHAGPESRHEVPDLGPHAWVGLPTGRRPATVIPLPDRRLARLVRTIETEIIPRLMLAHRATVTVRDAPAARPARASDVEELTRLILGHDVATAATFVQALRAQGMSADAICLDLLAPAARRLGDLWTDDRCNFTEVTIGLWRLQQVMRELSPPGEQRLDAPSADLRVLLAPAPGEQHTFGLMMVAEFFRRAGWDVQDETPNDRGSLVAAVRADTFDVIGLSASCEDRLDELAVTIRAVRRASSNRHIGVLVGGPLFVAHPEHLHFVGGDAIAGDARESPVQAQGLVDMLLRHR